MSLQSLAPNRLEQLELDADVALVEMGNCCDNCLRSLQGKETVAEQTERYKRERDLQLREGALRNTGTIRSHIVHVANAGDSVWEHYENLGKDGRPAGTSGVASAHGGGANISLSYCTYLFRAAHESPWVRFVRRSIGQGATAIVRAMRHKSTQRNYAMKTLNLHKCVRDAANRSPKACPSTQIPAERALHKTPLFSGCVLCWLLRLDPTAVQQLRKEVKLLGRLDHINIVKLFEVCASPMRARVSGRVRLVSSWSLALGRGFPWVGSVYTLGRDGSWGATIAGVRRAQSAGGSADASDHGGLLGWRPVQSPHHAQSWYCCLVGAARPTWHLRHHRCLRCDVGPWFRGVMPGCVTAMVAGCCCAVRQLCAHRQWRGRGGGATGGV